MSELPTGNVMNLLMKITKKGRREIMELQVMILDDEYIILDGLCSFPWSDYGYRISATARNGLEGLEKLEQAKPDLILTDVKMPGNGWTGFCRKST